MCFDTTFTYFGYQPIFHTIQMTHTQFNHNIIIFQKTTFLNNQKLIKGNMPLMQLPSKPNRPKINISRQTRNSVYKLILRLLIDKLCKLLTGSFQPFFF